MKVMQAVGYALMRVKERAGRTYGHFTKHRQEPSALEAAQASQQLSLQQILLKGCDGLLVTFN